MKGRSKEHVGMFLNPQLRWPTSNVSGSHVTRLWAMKYDRSKDGYS